MSTPTVNGVPARLVAPVTPSQGRTGIIKLSAKYEAGEQSSALRDWAPSSSRMPHEDAAFSPQIRSLTIARLRWEVRNNPYLAGLYAKYPEAIGTPALRIRTSDTAYNDKVEARFFKWAKKCTVDGDSIATFAGMCVAEMLVAGEVFVIQLADGRVQPVPSEYCGSPQRITTKAGFFELNGIGYGPDGNKAYYRFATPGANGLIDYAKGLPVEADFVIHLWMRDRIAMGRGLPWLLPSLSTARDLAEITRAKTKQIKDVSSVSGTIEREGARQLQNDLFQQQRAADAPAPTSHAVAPVEIELAPGTMVFLEPGEKANFLTSKYEATDYKELIMLMLHGIASPVGLPVELWFSGLGDVNYSGFKGLGTQWDARRRHIIAFLEDKLLDRLAVWWVQKARKIGLVPQNPDGDDTLMEWAWRVTAVLDEEKSAKAAKVRIDAGLSSHADEWERAGKFSDEVVAARVRLWNNTRAACGLPPEPCPLAFIFSGSVDSGLPPPAVVSAPA